MQELHALQQLLHQALDLHRRNNAAQHEAVWRDHTRSVGASWVRQISSTKQVKGFMRHV
jgi:hypothetical protein